MAATAEPVKDAPIPSPRLLERYKTEIVPALAKKVGRDNPHAIPKLMKISLNMGVGKALQDKERMKLSAEQLGLIAELHHKHRTATQVAAHLRLGRGQAGRDALARAAARLLARLQQAASDAGEPARVPATPDGDVVAEVLRLAPQTWCTRRRGS